MNTQEQLQPGSGGNGKLADVTIDDLLSELKCRCTAVAVVMIVIDDDGDEVLLVRTQGTRLAMLGAAEVIKQHYIEMNIKSDMDT